LTFAGYEALQAATGTDGLQQGLRATIDLLLLDLILPGVSGFEILRLVREARPTLSVIVAVRDLSPVLVVFPRGV